MKISKWLACTALVLPVAIGSQMVNAQQVGSDTGTVIPCSDLTFSKSFLAQYPKAPAACIEARTYHNKKYAKFDGKVFLKEGATTTIQVNNAAGDALTAITVQPTNTAKLMINGKETKFSDLKVGDAVSIWVAQDRFDFYSAPGHRGGKVVTPPAAK
ncbi:MAG: hypothetical protein JSR36_10090 [Proteobacteria bacterium]|nr:hypothetical protein [Pseudomonadota bacterium]